MKVEWLGLSCFRISSGDRSLIMDPYCGVRGYGDIGTSADLVFKSHDHGDHSYLAGVTLTGRSDTPFKIETYKTFHDDAGGKKRGPNTVHVISAEGFRVVHLGDLGHIPDRMTVEALKGADLLLIPVGGFYTIDAQAAKRVCEMLAPKAIVPMHYRHGEYGHEPIGTLDAFLSLFPACEVTILKTAELSLPASGVIIPKYEEKRN